MTTDLRLVAPALAVWCTAALLLAGAPETAYAVAVVSVVAAALLMRVRWLIAGAVLAGVAASAAGTGLRLTAVGSGPVRELARAQRESVVEAVVTADPQARSAGRIETVLVRARAELVRVRTREVKVRVPILLIASDRTGPWGSPPTDQPAARGPSNQPAHARLIGDQPQHERGGDEPRRAPGPGDQRGRGLSIDEEAGQGGRGGSGPRWRGSGPSGQVERGRLVGDRAGQGGRGGDEPRRGGPGAGDLAGRGWLVGEQAGPDRGSGGEQRWRGLVPSQRVRLTARLTMPRRAELLAAVGIVRGPPIVLGRPSAVQRAAETVRAKLREACEGLPSDQRGVLPGMVVGDASRLDVGVARDFETAGLTHLLVVSGANLAIVAGAVMALCRFAGLGRRRAPLIAAVALLAFVVVARPEPSVLRATVMSLIGLLAFFTGRERQGLPALGGAVILLVLLDPGLARSYGFVLSVLATAGLLVLAPPWRDRLRRRMPGPLAEALAVSAAAQLVCAPVLVMFTGQISVVSVMANLVATPAVAPATLLGALAAVVAPAALPVARLLVWPAGLAVGWIVGVARTAAAMPYATIPWLNGALGAVVLLATLLAAVAALRFPPLRLVVAAIAGGAILAGVALRQIAPRWPPSNWLYVACDVGQGDASVLSVGRQRAVVVDAGPDPRLVDSCLDRLGVRAVPLLILTHPHADHIDGVPGVRRGRTLGTVVTSPLTDGKELRLVTGLGVRAAGPGQVWKIGDLSLSVVGPIGTLRTEEREGSAINNASVVLVARRPGFAALLTGDVETEAQRALISSVPPVQLLKVPHHGSRRQEPAFLAAAHAAVSITSVGRDNDYGHPAPATLGLLRRLGARPYRTDLDGDIAIVRTPGGLAVFTKHVDRG